MYLGEQLPNPSDARLTLAAQLGVQHIVVEMGSELYDASDTGRWDIGRVRQLQARAATNGIAVDVIGLEMRSVLLDIIRGDTARRDAQLAVIAHNIRAAGEAGVPCLKYNLHIIGIPRTGRTPGRGGALYPHFDIAEASDEALAAYTGQALGQSRAAEVGPVSPQESWDAFTYFLERVIPVAEESGVCLAFHPQDPPLPHDTGLRGFYHVLSSIEGLKRYLDLTPSRYHVMNFCQGTVAEMCSDPATEVLEAIRYFGERG
jgi:mannonate dehydratase